MVRGYLLIVLVLLLAGCGGGANEEALGTSVSKQEGEADRRLAEESALTIKDFPKGWSADEVSEGRDDELCAGFAGAEQAMSGRSEAPGFSGEAGSGVLNKVYLFPDTATAEDVFSVFAKPDTIECVGEKLSDTLSDDEAKVHDVVTASLDTPTVGDATAANRMTFVLNDGEQTYELVLDLVAIRKARGLTVLVFFHGLARFDESLRNRLMRATANRLSERLA
jgi:hypothetical protein